MMRRVDHPDGTVEHFSPLAWETYQQSRRASLKPLLIYERHGNSKAYKERRKAVHAALRAYRGAYES